MNRLYGLIGAFILCFFVTSCRLKPIKPDELDKVLFTQATLGYPTVMSDKDESIASEFLLEKLQFTLAYQTNRGISRWASWHVQASDLGTYTAENVYIIDDALPSNTPRIRPTDYNNTGFDRGQLCPVGDRSASENDNSTTFVLTNIIPQAPALKQGVWKQVEDYCRSQVKAGWEAYQYAGSFGDGGKGTMGEATSIANGKISVPRRFWKVVLLIPAGENDLQRITKDNVEVFAVNIPNNQDITSTDWKQYKVSVREIEGLTGLNFFSKLPTELQNQLEN
ncbi:DNA/RNA non-specific endonuclease [Siphonobacter sp. SORGH_AS_1065]|uniref:DNA/RNA non-specific endonuclease n=1 Tax=Siphonobacter sp. SORGH_AS_1065 TaxID=3041795 RepID=UPI0027D7BEE3|nr:DNA/RNA non-specific endonuclease [Siphonobacter sp. SORGH_AS_1065]